MSIIETIGPQKFPRPSRPIPSGDDFLPPWTWEELELALLSLPLPMAQRLAAIRLGAATRMASAWQTPIATLKEVIALVSGLGEEMEQPRLGASSGEGTTMP